MKRIIYTTAAAIAISATASAQTLTKEITIERTVNPTLRAASRLGSSPAVLQPEIKVDPLKFSEVTLAAETGAAVDTLPAATPSAAITPSPYRGYAAIGYFPTYNLGASAGFRAIDRTNTSLGVWAQFDGSSYKHSFNGDPDDIARFSRNTATAGADFTTIINRAGRLDASADFTYDNLRNPFSSERDPQRYSATLLNTELHWSARNTEMAYFLSGEYHNFSFHHSPSSMPTQHDYSFKGGTAYFFDQSTQLAGSIGARFLSTSNYIIASNDKLSAVRSRTLGIIDFAPAFRYKSDMWKLNLGVKLQFMSHMEKTINFAPDIQLTATPVSWLGATLALEGGKTLNSLASLWQWCPYINPSMAYDASNIPLDASLSVTVGPFYGAWATVKGGYAMANDWLMADCDLIEFGSGEYSLTVMPVYLESRNLRAAYGQLSIGWKHSPLLEAQASVSFSGSGRHAWYMNRDGAKIVVNIEAKSSPVDRLEVRASFDMRIGRPKYVNDLFASNLNSLNLGATYALTDAFSVFANLENILCNRAAIVPYIPQQGIHGAVGAALKF